MAVKTALITFDAQMTAAYKQAVQAYANIQKTVNGMSAQWQRANGGLIAHVNYMRQAQVVMQQNATALRNVVNSQKQNSQHAQSMATAWKNTKSSVGYVADKMHRLINLGKRFGLFALAGAGGSIFGLDRLATSLSSSYTSATGLGMSYGQRQAFGLAFGRFGDTKAMLGAVSHGRLDTSSPQAAALWGAGIDPKGPGNTGSMALQYLKWIQGQVAGKTDAELGYLMRGRHTDLMGYNDEVLRNVRDRPDEVAAQIKKLAIDEQQLELDKKLLVGWQNFLTALDTAGENLKVIFGKAFVGLTDPLSKLSTAITETVKSLVEGQNFKWAIEELAKGITSLGQWLNSDSFKKDIKEFGDNITLTAHIIEAAGIIIAARFGLSTIAAIGAAAGTAASVGGAVAGAAPAAAVIGSAGALALGRKAARNWAVNYAKSGADDYRKNGTVNVDVGAALRKAGSAISSTIGTILFWPDMNLHPYKDNRNIGMSGTGASNDDVAFFMSKGWSKEQAIGIVANIIGESGGNPFAPGDGGQAYGLAQWHPDRRAAYRMLFGHDMEDVKDFATAKREQLEFIDWELRHTEAAAGMRLAGATTEEGATAAFGKHFERYAANPAEDIRRGAIASSISRGIPQSSIRIDNYTGNAVSISGSNLGLSTR